MSFLRSWNFSDRPDEQRPALYRETPRPDGTMFREYQLHAVDRDIEIAPGLFFPAWTFNGQVPGPTIRATEGDRLKITFKNLANITLGGNAMRIGLDLQGRFKLLWKFNNHG